MTNSIKNIVASAVDPNVSNGTNGSAGFDDDHELPDYLTKPLPATGENSPRSLERREEQRRLEQQQELAQQGPMLIKKNSAKKWQTFLSSFGQNTAGTDVMIFLTKTIAKISRKSSS
jgi:hypothetical protein